MMQTDDQTLNLRFLDHVAIIVSDMERSIEWYQTVLDLKPYRLEAWGGFPVFMLCGKTGVAIFPSDHKDQAKGSIRIHHFAFNVDQENFKKARARYEQLGILYDFQDHHYFHSIYTNDPDGHRVELTCIQVPEEHFYK